ncbi:MAG TPA: hypothetical protein VHV10_10260 [Ktedonobacteraceae bacterium]|nr:hypothetical protein [Ktedonobacteraceae bacterium]
MLKFHTNPSTFGSAMPFMALCYFWQFSSTFLAYQHITKFDKAMLGTSRTQHLQFRVDLSTPASAISFLGVAHFSGFSPAPFGLIDLSPNLETV